MKAIRIEPGKKPEIIEQGEDLKALQAAVDGYIECVYPFYENVCLIVNEEGKLNQMPLNRCLKDDNGEIYDIIAGPFLVVGITDDSFCSLSEELIEKYVKKFETPEQFVRANGLIYALPMPVEN